LLPAKDVGPYAEQDAISTLLLHENLIPILDQEGTRDAYRLDCDIMPMVAAMQARGLRIDTNRAEQARDLFYVKRDQALAELSKNLKIQTGIEELGKDAWLTRTFDREGVAYPRTKTGNPSFQGGADGWMTGHAHWLPRLVSEANKYHTAAYKFVQLYLLNHTVNGRIHADIHPHRSASDLDEGYGTKSFRFSYSSPPLQQIPARNEAITPLIRNCFLPEQGEFLANLDVSQQEPRLVTHFAYDRKLKKADIVRDRYCNDPKADFHQITADLTRLGRYNGKKFNFSKIYGAGIELLARQLKLPVNEAQKLLDQYDRGMPFLSQLDRLCKDEATNKGYLVLYDGARRHFNRYAPSQITWTKGMGPCDLEEAKRRQQDPNHPWYRLALSRVDVLTALNALIQGSAARHTKLWMRAVWRECRSAKVLLQMHDALLVSTRSREEIEHIARLGENCIKLHVPMKIDRGYGVTWAGAKHSWEELQKLFGAAPQTTLPRLPKAMAGHSPRSRPQSLRAVRRGTSRPSASSAAARSRMARHASTPTTAAGSMRGAGMRTWQNGSPKKRSGPHRGSRPKDRFPQDHLSHHPLPQLHPHLHRGHHRGHLPERPRSSLLRRSPMGRVGSPTDRVERHSQAARRRCRRADRAAGGRRRTPRRAKTAIRSMTRTCTSRATSTPGRSPTCCPTGRQSSISTSVTTCCRH
jgi:hypothetical protein